MPAKINNKRDLILLRSKIIFGLFLLLGMAASTRILYLQTVSRSKWQLKLEQTKTERSKKPTPSMRGNIFAADGSLLATTVPYYTVSLDPQLSDSTYFFENIDAFCIGISKITKEKTPGEYKGIILNAKLAGFKLKKEMIRLQTRIKNANGDTAKIKAIRATIDDIRLNQMVQYIKLNKKQLTHRELMEVKKLPFSWENIKRKEKGLMREDTLVREHPFNGMARRTIGNDDKTSRYGIEAKFHKELYGKYGEGWQKKIGPRTWVPVEDKPYQLPVNGKDIYTTLDMNFQDIAEVALKRRLVEANAEDGCVVIMDIKTGDIKAMVNLGQNEEHTDYYEDKNYAVKEGFGDPGSTFKLASMMALIDNFNPPMNTIAATCNKTLDQGSGGLLSCSHAHGAQTIPQIFANSCNIGVYELIKQYFKNPDDFLRIIRKDYKLIEKVIPDHLDGEPTPNIKDRRNPKWSSISLSRMSIGYEVDITPLQMLTFYNAVANDGTWVKPRLVLTVLSDKIEEIIKVKPSTEKLPLKSAETIKKLKNMMEGVVQFGTAKNKSVSEGICKIAGKTGTAFRIINGSYNSGNQAVSFIGYFPADNPRYSCAISIRGVKQNANTVSAPAFREIADRVFAYDITMHDEIALQKKPLNLTQNIKKGLAKDFQTMSKTLTMSVPNGKGIVKTQPNGVWESQQMRASKMPDVRGMTLREALFVLENKGFKVGFSGLGKVKTQSIEPNATIVRRQNVSLVLD